MFDNLKRVLGQSPAPQPRRAQPSRALVPMPMPTQRLREAESDRPTASFGYMDRHADSARPMPYVPLAPMHRSADAEVRIAHGPVAGAVRHLLTQSGFLSHGVELNATWIVGGYGLEPSISLNAARLGWTDKAAKQWADELEAGYAEWSDHSESCDAQGRLKFGAMQSAMVKSYLGTGDVIAVLDYGEKSGSQWKTSLNLIDPSRIWTPPLMQNARAIVKDGIEFDERGRAIAYHVRPPIGANVSDIIRIPVRNPGGKKLLVHTFDAEPGAIRGISPLGAAIGGIMQAMNLHDAAVLQAHIASTIVGIVTSDLPSDAVARAIGGDGDPLGAMMHHRVSWHETLKKADAHLRLGNAGRIVHLSTGERFELHAGKVPFDQHEKIIRLGLAEAARALGLAPEHLHGLKDQATYSALKTAIAEARAVMERRRRIIVEPVCEFALFSVAEEMIADGRLAWMPEQRGSDKLADFRRRRAAVKVEWRGPGIEDPDAMKATMAAINRVRFGLSSLTDEIAAQGKDAERVFDNRAADQQALKERGLDLPWPLPAVPPRKS